MQPATIKPQRKPMKVIRLTSRSRKPATGMCNLSFASVEKPASRKKPSKRVIEKLLPATSKAASLMAVRTQSNIDSHLAESLLSDVKAIFKSKKVAQLRTQSILDALADKKPWSTICNGNPIGARRFASLVKPYGINSRDIRFSGSASAYKGYKKEWFVNAG